MMRVLLSSGCFVLVFSPIGWVVLANLFPSHLHRHRWAILRPGSPPFLCLMRLHQCRIRNRKQFPCPCSCRCGVIIAGQAPKLDSRLTKIAPSESRRLGRTGRPSQFSAVCSEEPSLQTLIPRLKKWAHTAKALSKFLLSNDFLRFLNGVDAILRLPGENSDVGRGNRC